MDLVNDASIVRTIEINANKIYQKSYHGIELDDALQEMWAETFKVWATFNSSCAHTFNNFLATHLKFRAINIVRDYYIRKKDYTLPVAQTVSSYEETFEVLCSRIYDLLNDFEKDIFEQLINPNPELFKIAEAGRERTYRGKTRAKYDIKNWHLAIFFETNEMKTSRAIIRIKEVVLKTLNKNG